MIKRFFRELRPGVVFAVAMLIVVSTICFGFVKREQQADTLLGTSQALVEQVHDLKEQLAEEQKLSVQRSKAAAQERDDLQKQLALLVQYLRDHGLRPPVSPSGVVVLPKAPATRAVTSLDRSLGRTPGQYARPSSRPPGQPSPSKPSPSKPSPGKPSPGKPSHTSPMGAVMDTVRGAAGAVRDTAEATLERLGGLS